MNNKSYFKYISCFIVMFLSMFILVSDIDAKTLGELENELSNKKNELSNNQAQQQLTEDEMKTINNNLAIIQKNINQIQIDTTNLENEITALEEEIIVKKEEINKIISYFQISSGDSAYLDYVMGAQDFTDFIYRSSVTEQLTKYNDDLIASFNATIDENNAKKEELANKKVELSNQQKEMHIAYEKLGTSLASYSEQEMIITNEVESLQEMVKIYKNKGCKSNEDIATCGRKTLPEGTAFYRPLVTGYVTSWFGGRDCSDPRVSCGHNGIDFSTYNKTNVPVYSIGTGMVAAITYKSSCGGNMVFVHHKLTNGNTYTSVYMHLYKINVSKGDTVTKDTVIGIMGGGWSTPWDYCSTGPHSHLGIATGLYGIDYSGSSLRSRYINPRSLINTPGSLYTPFYDRFTAF